MVYDFVVIGGGTAGIVSSRTAAGAGAGVAMAERETPGGDVLWTGCVPSKSLIAAAGLAHKMRSADALGFEPHEPKFDFANVMERVHAAQMTIEPQDSADALRRDGVEVIEASGRFDGPGRIAVDGRDIRFRTALIATGSRPNKPNLSGLDEVDPLTNETFWDLREQPRRLVILGGGPIGCELGQAFRRLGSEVSIVQRRGYVLAKEEPDARELVAGRLRDEGVDLRLGFEPERIEPDGKGGTLIVKGPGGEDRIEFDRIMVAAGRSPETDGLGLETVGVETDKRGGIVVDERLATTGRNIYAAGDAVTALPFTHVAAYHARTVLTNALFRTRTRVDYTAVPWATFTDPEVGRVGLTEADARERWGDRAVAVKFDYADNDRAITASEAYGFAKLVGDPRGRLVGGTVAAPHGGESVAELAAWVRTGRKVDDVSQTVHAYPTFTEGQARAADDHLRAKYLNDRVRRIAKPALALLRVVDRPR